MRTVEPLLQFQMLESTMKASPSTSSHVSTSTHWHSLSIGLETAPVGDYCSIVTLIPVSFTISFFFPLEMLRIEERDIGRKIFLA